MFQIGDMVVHPGYGVGKVVDIEKLACLGSDKRYYSIRLVDDGGTQVWVPVEEAEGRGVRHPILRSQLKKIWRALRAKPEELPSEHKKRYGIVREKVDDGDSLQIAEALRDLSWKDYHVRSLTSEGKRLYDKAMKFLTAEIAVVQGSDREAVESEVSRVLNENVVQREAAE